MTTILLIDLSSLFFPIFHMSGKEPDVDHASRATVARVHSLASGYDHVAVCCDSGRSFRKDLDPNYKANRPERDERLIHQLKLAQETLEADGFAVWSVPGYEADDLIGTATKHALAMPDVELVVASSDKDLLQLVGERVSAKSLTTGNMLDPAGVKEKLGVTPEQVRDYLILVGDSSDNIKGVPGVGPKRAVELLTKHGSIAAILARLDQKPEALGITPSVHKALSESVVTMDLARKLVTLATDVPIPFDDIFKPRTPKAAATFAAGELDHETEEEEHVHTIDHDPKTGEVVQEESPNRRAEATVTALPSAQSNGDSKKSADVEQSMIVRPPSWDLALEPQNAGAAYKMAAYIFNSRLFSNMPNQDAVFSVILMGRTLGIDALTMLRNVHVIEGKVTLAAPLIVGLVLKSGKADYFKCIETTNEKAVYKTHRKGDPDPDATILEYTIEDAKRQQLLLPIEPNKKPGNWLKIPKTMLRHRCSTELARAVYPDVVAGLYSPDEFGHEVRPESAA